MPSREGSKRPFPLPKIFYNVRCSPAEEIPKNDEERLYGGPFS